MRSLKKQIVFWNQTQYAQCALAALIAAIFYFAGYRPQTLRAMRLDGEVAQADAQLTASQFQARNLPSVASDINKLLNQLADAKKLPTHADLGDFEVSISQFAHQANLQSFTVSLSGTQTRDESLDCFEMPVSFKFHGDSKSVFDFICSVESMPRLTRLCSLNVRRMDSGQQVSVELVLRLYYSEG
jgi:Tfp pilus assembly protein PilO